MKDYALQLKESKEQAYVDLEQSARTALEGNVKMHEELQKQNESLLNSLSKFKSLQGEHKKLV